MTDICRHRYRHGLGFGLVELMIALLLAAFLIGGILQIFFSAKKSYTLQENMAQLQDSGRNALYLIAEDIRMAGYWGCGTKPPLVSGLNGSNFFNAFAKPLQGFEASTDTKTQPATWSPALDASFLTTPYTPLPGSDVLTLRRANAPGITVSSHESKSAPLLLAATGTQLAQAEISEENISKGLLAIVVPSDCSQPEAFQITGLQGNAIAHIAAPKNNGNQTNELTNTYPNGKVHTAHTISYFVGENPNQEKLLFRRVDQKDPEELVDGVEEMQVLYGIDTDPDKDEAPNYYVTANQVPENNWQNVTSIRVSFLVASLDDRVADVSIPYRFNGVEKTPADHKLRRVFTSTIKIRNRFH